MGVIAWWRARRNRRIQAEAEAAQERERQAARERALEQARKLREDPRWNATTDTYPTVTPLLTRGQQARSRRCRRAQG